MDPNSTKPLIITIDGPAGAGKSTVARGVAEKTGLHYLDTGAIYRAVAWWLSKKGISPSDEADIEKAMKDFSLSFDKGKIYVCGRDVTKDIRMPEVDCIVSSYSALRNIRDSLLSLQREQAEEGLVADGRDMGTVVFPDADLKVFLTASAEERASRRYKERIARGETADYDEILKQVNERDRYDTDREIAPLRPAQGCIILDSTDMTIDEVVDAISALASEFGRNKHN
ncbi:MAG: (d)CMP kinase [Synergistaceae bacterium]|nr:(d)CMP kinase [Synergistaceae bacterium]